MKTVPIETFLNMMFSILSTDSPLRSTIPTGKMKVDKSEKPICNLHRNKKYVIQMKAVKQAVDHGVILDKVHEVIA